MRWLQLRRNAFKRCIYFDPDITPDYLGSLGADYCPVTGETMTVGTKTDTDGSIDRVNSDYGYTVGNVIMMSVRANKARGCMSADQIRGVAARAIESNGLSAHSWSVLNYIVDVTEESFTGNPRQLLDGDTHIAGLNYALSADVQASITALMAIESNPTDYSHPIGMLFSMLQDCSQRKSSKSLCYKLAKEINKSTYIGNGRMVWCYWKDKKIKRLFNEYWRGLLDDDKARIAEYLAHVRTSHSFANTPKKSLFRELASVDTSLLSDQSISRLERA